MADPQQVLAQRVRDAIVASFGPDYSDADPLIRPSAFADFQANAALSLAKRVGRPPREVAAELAVRLDVTGICAEPEVSGPGFINLTLRDDWIAAQAWAMLGDDRLGLAPAAAPQKVVVEYSSPNIAKEMHVGHLRTTIVGDAIARVLEFAGHRVIRDNHVGDWGTQFGMLIEYLLDVGQESAEAGLLRTDPNAFYQAARRRFESDPGFADRARKRVVDLQGGDPATLQLWQELVDLSMDYLHRIYGRLGVTLTDADIKGESFYNPMLADTVARLEEQGIAVHSDGALCAFPAGFTGREGRPMPVIIRKSDGGYNYSTTDLATVRYRVDVLHCDRAIYVVGSTRRCTSRWCSRWPGRRAGYRRAPSSSTLRSAWSSARTATGCAPGPAIMSSSATCWRKPSIAPGPSSTRLTRPRASTPPSLTRSPRPSASGR